jgi:hypothetical protein
MKGLIVKFLEILFWAFNYNFANVIHYVYYDYCVVTYLRISNSNF